MTMPGWLLLNIYVFLLATVLLLFSTGQHQRKMQSRTFNLLVIVIMFLLTGDSLSRINAVGKSIVMYKLMRLGNYLIFAFDPLEAFLSFLYIASWVGTKKRSKQRIYLYVAGSFVLLNFILVTISEIGHFEWFYGYVNRTYVRGDLFLLRAFISMGIGILVEVYAVIYRKNIPLYYRRHILAFPLIAIVAGFLQTFIQGAAFEYAGMILACMILYTFVQSRDLDTDYLTGVFNRRGMDHELDRAIQKAENGKNFSVVLIDLDDFKKINDAYGHDIGDMALRDTARILLRCFGQEGRVGRFGGDEFLVILDTGDEKSLEERLQRLKKEMDLFNQNGQRIYQLRYSVGASVYQKEQMDSKLKFFRRVDEMMYQEKREHHLKDEESL